MSKLICHLTPRAQPGQPLVSSVAQVTCSLIVLVQNSVRIFTSIFGMKNARARVTIQKEGKPEPQYVLVLLLLTAA